MSFYLNTLGRIFKFHGMFLGVVPLILPWKIASKFSRISSRTFFKKSFYNFIPKYLRDFFFNRFEPSSTFYLVELQLVLWYSWLKRWTDETKSWVRVPSEPSDNFLKMYLPIPQLKAHSAFEYLEFYVLQNTLKQFLCVFIKECVQTFDRIPKTWSICICSYLEVVIITSKIIFETLLLDCCALAVVPSKFCRNFFHKLLWKYLYEFVVYIIYRTNLKKNY